MNEFIIHFKDWTLVNIGKRSDEEVNDMIDLLNKEQVIYIKNNDYWYYISWKEIKYIVENLHLKWN